MKLKLNNDADVHAITQIASLQNCRSIASIIGNYAQMCPDDEDFTVEINKELLTATYRANPSLFASRVNAIAAFATMSGHQHPTNPAIISIKLYRQEKTQTPRGTSIKAVTKQWLNSTQTRQHRLSVPITAIPPFFQTHPEQFTYQIKCETQTKIKILKLKKSWLISRK